MTALTSPASQASRGTIGGGLEPSGWGDVPLPRDEFVNDDGCIGDAARDRSLDTLVSAFLQAEPSTGAALIGQEPDHADMSLGKYVLRVLPE